MRRMLLATVGSLLWLGWTGALLSIDVPKKSEKPIDPDHAAKMARGLDLFKKSVRPVLVQHCLRCHGGDVTESEFDITDRDKLLKGGLAGPAIVPGDAQKSLLFHVVNHSKKPRMPHKEPKLPAEAITAIGAWIDSGTPFDKPLVDRGDGAAWTKTVVPNEAKQLWSLQALKKVEPPAVKGDWARTPIDQFVLAKLQVAGVDPNPAVDRRKLIRRAYFDLIGLPPPPEAVEAFLKDGSPTAFAKVVDELLNSQHYGERWARHWLDVTRFAESHGFEHDYDRPSAYHYRDFVIKALNDGLPFDTFVKWQLAGDEPPNDNLALTATGFLAAGVHSTQITKNEVEKHRYDELDDMLATTGTAMLGLTIGCARCHDHKFDPIPQRDYYQMLSAFTTTVRSDIDLDLDPAGYRKAKAAFDKDHEPLVAARTKLETEHLPDRLAAWEKSAGALEKQPWIILDQLDARAGQGVIFKKLDDGSFLATGAKPQNDTYTFSTVLFADKITGIRLEALSDPSLTKGGPGRADNGNFALTKFTVTSTPLSPFSGAVFPTLPLRLTNPRATFEQKGLPVASAIDGKGSSGWAVDPQFGKDHAAVFDVELPEGYAAPWGEVLAFKLEFKNNQRHAIGRPRLAITTAKGPVDLQAASLPLSVRSALTTPPSRRISEHTAGLLKWYRTQDPEWQKLDRLVQEHAAKAPKANVVKALISTEGLAAVRLHTQGEDFLKETHFLRRGDPLQKEGVAPPSYLQILMRAPDQEKRWPAQPPAGSRSSFRRKAFADWLTDVDHGAGQLLARVIVNRLWQHHLGRGIVATPNDFGTRGEKPTHPELLDWLAGELIRNQWKLKPIHQLIMTSAVYQQSSQFNPAKAAKDPDNRLLWHRPARRLEGEIIRDAMLSLSGQLDAKMYGPGTLDESSKRRSIYFTVKRSKLMPMMVVFDAPEALSSIGDRPTTTIAPQALLLMNNAQVRGYARGLAKRMTTKPDAPLEAAIGAGYRHALCRDATTDELRDSTAFVRQQWDSYQASGKAESRELALTDFCQVLMCLNEFVYVE